MNIKKYYITKEFLIKEYIVNKKSSVQIAKELNCSQSLIYQKLIEYNIRTRSRKEHLRLYPPTGKNNPNYKYGLTNQKNYCIDCGKELSDYRPKRCQHCFGKINVIIRNYSKEAQLKAHKKQSKTIQGSNHPNWKGGIESFNSILRHLFEYKQWRNQVFKRDNYTCQDCGQYGGKLEAHHKKPFAELLSEFLQEYNQFSWIEDRKKLINLAIKYESFWDTNNEQTLCENCHPKTDNYKNKRRNKCQIH